MLARTVVLVSALALLGYLPAANPLTAPSLRERPPGNFAKQNCRIRASGLNCFCRNLKHEARRVAEVPRSALREGGTAMLLIAAKTHQTIGWQVGEQPIIHSDALASGMEAALPRQGAGRL